MQAWVQTSAFNGSVSVSPHNTSAQTATLLVGGSPILNLTSGASLNITGASYNTVNASVKSYRLCLPQGQAVTTTQGARSVFMCTVLHSRSSRVPKGQQGAQASSMPALRMCHTPQHLMRPQDRTIARAPLMHPSLS